MSYWSGMITITETLKSPCSYFWSAVLLIRYDYDHWDPQDIRERFSRVSPTDQVWLRSLRPKTLPSCLDISCPTDQVWLRSLRQGPIKILDEPVVLLIRYDYDHWDSEMEAASSVIFVLLIRYDYDHWDPCYFPPRWGKIVLLIRYDYDHWDNGEFAPYFIVPGPTDQVWLRSLRLFPCNSFRHFSCPTDQVWLRSLRLFLFQLFGFSE